MSEDESENTDGNYYNITHNFNKSDFTTQLFSNPVVVYQTQSLDYIYTITD